MVLGARPETYLQGYERKGNQRKFSRHRMEAGEEVTEDRFFI